MNGGVRGGGDYDSGGNDEGGGGEGALIESASQYTLMNAVVEEPFQAKWKEITGTDHTYSPVQLTADELLGLPTILVQLGVREQDNEGGGGVGSVLFSDDRSPTVLDPDSTPGMTGTRLDPENPRDVLLAIPAVHYMEGMGNGQYRFRVSLKSPGSTVLGANALMGHRLNFDLAGGRIGFAEAGSCFDDYDYDNGPKTYQENRDGSGDDYLFPWGGGNKDDPGGGGPMVPTTGWSETKPTTTNSAAGQQDDTAPAIEGREGASASLLSPWTSNRDRMITTPEMTFSFYVPYLSAGGTLLILALVLLIRDRACRKWSGNNGSIGNGGAGVSLDLS